MATKSKPSDDMDATSTMTDDDRSVMDETMEATGRASRGVGSTVRNVLHETIDVTEQVGTDVGRVARDAAIGLVGGVGAVGGAAVGTARDLLVDVVGGVRDVIGAAVTGSGRRTGRTTASRAGSEMRPEDRV